jgi:hypothetical protein
MPRRNRTATNGEPRVARRTFFLIIGVWLAVAVNLAVSGALRRVPVPPPAIAVALTAGLLLLLRVSRHVRAAAWSVGPTPLVAFHLIRIAAGAYFLILYRRGVLPGEFAIPAGWGDIAVGVAALAALAVRLPPRTGGQRIALLVWNTAGLIDILGVLANGMRIFRSDPAIGEPFTSFPLALLPTFVVPLVIVSHVLLFGWITRRVANTPAHEAPGRHPRARFGI